MTLPMAVAQSLLMIVSAASSPTPLRYGVDDAGGPPRLDTLPWAKEIFDDFGFDLWVMHYQCTPSIAANRAYIAEVDAWCAENGIAWIANVETSNWIKSFADEKGRDWLNRTDGRHYFVFPDELLDALAGTRKCLGVMHDEAAHMQSCNNLIAKVHRPFFYDPAGDQLEDAADAFTEAARKAAQPYISRGLGVYTEHVFPILYHAFARAGFTAPTKILKETWPPLYIACAMGAARQYGTELWVTPDLWGLGDYPGHSVEAYRSALLLAYYLGADCIYTENLAYNGKGKGEGKGALIKLTNGTPSITPYGAVTRWFIKEYVPSHPRHYRFETLRPRVAIVRQPDGCWGQGGTWYPDTLFGHPGWRPGAATRAWIDIWHLLTRGETSRASLSWIGAGYAGMPFQVFCPLEGVALLDHHAKARDLSSAEVIFLTGLGISSETQSAVADCVRAGAICVALPHLLPVWAKEHCGRQGSWKEGLGTWMATEDFLSEAVRAAVEFVLPEPNTIRYRFGETLVVLRRDVTGDPNRVAEICVNGQQVYTAPPG